MSKNNLILLLIFFLSSLIAFGIIVILQHILFVFNKSNIGSKFKNNKKILINLINIIFISIILIFINFAPFFQASKDSFFINFLYIPLIYSIGCIFGQKLMLKTSVLLIISIIIGYAFLLNETVFFTSVTVQIASIISCVIIVFITNINEKKITILTNIISSFVLFGIILILSLFILDNNQYKLITLLSVAIAFFLNILFFNVGVWYKNFNKKLDYLTNVYKYEQGYFLNYKFAKQVIHNKIKTNNISYGLIIIFDYVNINRLPLLWGNNTSNYIKNIIIQELANVFSKIDTVFFITNNNQYACFINFNQFNINNLNVVYDGNLKQFRVDDDPIKNIQNIMLNIPKNVIYEGIEQKINAGAYGAIYGVHSCDLDELIRFAYATKKQTANNKRGIILDIYNPYTIHEFNFDSSKNIMLNQYFNSNNLEIKMNNKTKNISFDVSCVERLLFNYKDIKQFANNHNVGDITQRLIAMQCLKKFVSLKQYKSKIAIINYPINYLISNKFNFGDFKNKLNFIGISISNIVLNLDISDLNNLNDEFINIKSLQQNKCQIMLNGVNSSNIELISKIKPNFINIDNNSDLYSELENIKHMLNKFQIEVTNINN